MRANPELGVAQARAYGVEQCNECGGWEMDMIHDPSTDYFDHDYSR
jgi:hypothetical protein